MIPQTKKKWSYDKSRGIQQIQYPCKIKIYKIHILSMHAGDFQDDVKYNLKLTFVKKKKV